MSEPNIEQGATLQELMAKARQFKQPNKAQHSPLPWRTVVETDFEPCAVCSNDGEEMVHLVGGSKWERATNAKLIVASVNYCEALEARIDGKPVSMKEYTSDRLHAALLREETLRNHAGKLAEAGERLKNAVSDLINEPRTLEIEHYAETALHDWQQTLSAYEIGNMVGVNQADLA